MDFKTGCDSKTEDMEALAVSSARKTQLLRH